MTDYSKLYDDYLYDCYVANQHLTDEDWVYYGKEKHHIDVPNRDGGLLTPLNSQYLTTYQHWIAGVLQSEVLGYCCFAFVPVNTLLPPYESLRDKWHRHQASERNRQRYAQMTPEERSEILRKANANRTPEQRSEAVRKANANRSPEVVAETVRRMIAARNAETQRRATLNRWANRTPEQRAETARQAWETRRRNQQGG